MAQARVDDALADDVGQVEHVVVGLLCRARVAL
jgi:hypothetical protein